MTQASPDRPSRRFALSPLALNVLVSLFILAAYNRVFWGHAVEIFGQTPVTFALFTVAIFTTTMFLVSLGNVRGLRRAWLVFLLLVGASTSFYAQSMGVVVDRSMIQNIANTNTGEAGRMITAGFLWHMAIFGIVPAAAVILVPVRRASWWREILVWPTSIAFFFAATLGLLFIDYSAFSSAFRGHRELMYNYLPGAPVNVAFRYARMARAAADIVAQPLGRDATRGERLAATDRPSLTVIVVGETVRAANWGLNGYERDTTPALAQRDVLNYTDATSCGTSSAISVPCMFSILTRDGYSHERMLATENLLDVLTHAGLDVQWWENNFTSYGVTERTGNWWLMDATVNAEACAEGECYDSVFFDPLRDLLDTMTEDTVVVMHFVGSHGPAYYLRYPPDFERFQPACRDSDFTNCTQEMIVNAYDNTLAFTDYVLGEFIDMMAAQDRVATSLIYASDHGESLGESGVYLHGAPYFIAPAEQVEIPIVMWLSEAAQADLRIDGACLATRTDQPVSHDNLFHTVLALTDVVTGIADPELDLTAACLAP